MIRHLQFGCTGFALLIGATVSASALSAGLAIAHPTRSTQFDNLSKQVTAAHLPEVAAAKSVSISGSNGQFVGRVVASGSAAAAWAVLTDYNNFAAFLPNVESSRV